MSDATSADSPQSSPRDGLRQVLVFGFTCCGRRYESQAVIASSGFVASSTTRKPIRGAPLAYFARRMRQATGRWLEQPFSFKFVISVGTGIEPDRRRRTFGSPSELRRLNPGSSGIRGGRADRHSQSQQQQCPVRRRGGAFDRLIQSTRSSSAGLFVKDW